MNRILIIDDDPDIGLMMKMMLGYKGHSVTVIENATEVLDIITKNNFDLIFLDMLLSGLNGTDICTLIKATDNYKNVPIIMMSAHPDARNVCIQAGADDFISKPFDTGDMLSKINRLLKSKQ